MEIITLATFDTLSLGIAYVAGGCWKESDELINYTEISRVEEGTFVSVVWTPL